MDLLLFRLNETELNGRYLITFHYKNDLMAERSCNRTYFQLKKQIQFVNDEVKCNITDKHTKHTHSGYNMPQLEATYLTVKALEMVREKNFNVILH